MATTDGKKGMETVDGEARVREPMIMVSAKSYDRLLDTAEKYLKIMEAGE